MRNLLIVKVVARLVIPLILIFSLYVQAHGDFGPGGGFQAGVIFAAGFILYGLVFDLDHAREVVRPAWLPVLMAVGVLIYAGVGIYGLLLGGHFLEYNVLAANPVHGQHLGIMLIEIGVGITVAAVMVAIFFAFAGRGR